MICSGAEFRAENGSLARHTHNMHTYGSAPPPPPRCHRLHASELKSRRKKNNHHILFSSVCVCVCVGGGGGLYRTSPYKRINQQNNEVIRSSCGEAGDNVSPLLPGSAKITIVKTDFLWRRKTHNCYFISWILKRMRMIQWALILEFKTFRSIYSVLGQRYYPFHSTNRPIWCRWQLCSGPVPVVDDGLSAK